MYWFLLCPAPVWGHYKLSALSVCLSVRPFCPSVAWIDITWVQKGLKSPNLAGWNHITRVTSEPIYRSKGQSHQADSCLHSKCPISSEREGLLSSSLVHRRSMKTRISDKRRELQGQMSRSQGHEKRLTGVGRYVENEKFQKHQNWHEGCPRHG